MTCLHSSMSYHKCDNLVGEMPWSQRWGCPSHSDVGTPAMSPSVVSPTAWLVAGGPCPRFPLGLCRLKGGYCGTSLGVQSLRLWASTAGSGSSTPAWGTDEIPQAAQVGQKKKMTSAPSLGDVDSGGVCAWRGVASTQKISIPSPWFCCEPKTALKNKVCFFFFNELRDRIRPDPSAQNSMTGNKLQGIL